MECRPGCGACCIAPSISTASPKHPHGKFAGTRCGHLDADNLCELFQSELRPRVCSSFAASVEVCGANRQQALTILNQLEILTASPD